MANPATGGVTESTGLLLEVVRVFWRQQGVTGCSESTAATTPAATETRRGRSRRCGARLGLNLGAFESWHHWETNARAGRDDGAQGRPHRRPWRRCTSASMADPYREREG